MKKFLVVYHAPKEAMQQMANVTPDQQAEGMKAWMQWMQRVGPNMVDPGSPLINGQQINADGSEKPSSKNVSGYTIVQAENMEAAKALLSGHPHLNGWNKDCTIELHETMQLPGM